jgi:hypothetical protein
MAWQKNIPLPEAPRTEEVCMRAVEEELKLIKRGSEELLIETELLEKLKTGGRCGSRPALIRPHPICILGTPS